MPANSSDDDDAKCERVIKITRKMSYELNSSVKDWPKRDARIVGWYIVQLISLIDQQKIFFPLFTSKICKSSST